MKARFAVAVRLFGRFAEDIIDERESRLEAEKSLASFMKNTGAESGRVIELRSQPQKGVGHGKALSAS